MKKEGKVLALVFLTSVILILSVSFVSASLLGDIGNFFKKLFFNEKQNNQQGELGSLNPLGVVQSVPFYRLMNSINSDHMFTSDINEKNSLSTFRFHF